MKRSRAKLTFAFASLAVIAAVIFILWPRGPALRVLDPRMHVISARLLTGTNESFYAGNQLEGRARDFLKRISLHIETLPDVGKQPERFMGPTETCRFAIYFKWTGASDPAFVTAELVEISHSDISGESPRVFTSADVGARRFVIDNQSGHIIHTVPTSLAKFKPIKDYYMCVAELNPKVMNRGDFVLRFVNLPGQNDPPDSSNFDTASNCLAEIVIKRIPLNQVNR
jgi:hypothetical protein